MKLYNGMSPNGMRVNVFLAEKGIEVPTVNIDVMAGDTKKPDCLSINSLGEVPVLKLDDGQVITESLAICRYFEVLNPEPSLMGTSAAEQANIEMWTRRMEQQIFQAVGTIVYTKSRILPPSWSKYPTMQHLYAAHFPKDWHGWRTRCPMAVPI